MKLGVALALCLISACAAEMWRWPEDTAASVRIDTKVRFIDHAGDDKGKNHVISNVQADEAPFREPTETEGFYNRPPGAGRYPVRVEPNNHAEYQSKVLTKNYRESDMHCKCVSEPECEPRPESETACGYGQYLCCYKRPYQFGLQNSEYFNEVQDDRRLMLPGQETLAEAFPPPQGPPGSFFSPIHPGHSAETSHVRPYEGDKGILVGPEGPSGIIGPVKRPEVLVGPGGPTGIIGPGKRPDVLTGPGGPTGIIGPATGKPQQIRQSESAQRGVLVGPGGPTGNIGPFDFNRRPVLVGPGGPTGIIGPGRRGRGPGVLVGPGGPTGIIGPAGYGFRQGRLGGNAFLTGPEGPTNVIGPGRPILVGPGGPTGQIGPASYFG